MAGPDGHHVHALRDRFPEAIADEDWIPVLQRDGQWMILSRDRFSKTTRTGIAERALLRHRHLTVFVLDKGWGAFQPWELFWRLARWWPTLVQTAVSIAGGTGYQVPKNFPGHRQRKLKPLWLPKNS